MNKKVKNLIDLIRLVELEEWSKLEKELKAIDTKYVGILNELKWYVNTYTKVGYKVEDYKQVRNRILSTYFDNTNRKTQKLSETYQKLTGIVELFIIEKAIAEDEKLKQDIFLKIATKRRQADEYVKRIDNKKTIWKQGDERGLWYYNDLFQLNYLTFFHPFKIKSTKKDINVKDGSSKHQDLVNIHRNLDEFYVVAKLRLICELKFREFSLKERYNIPNLDTVIGAAYQLQHTNESVALYLQIYNILKKRDYDSVKELEDLLAQAGAILSNEECESVFFLLTNVIAFKMNADNNVKDQLILYNFYKMGIQERFYDGTRIIDPIFFTNVVQLGALYEKGDWLSEFIKKYEQSLPFEIRENMVALCKAIVIYGSDEDNKWAEMSKILNTVQFQEPSFEIKVRTYLAQAFFEEGYIQGKKSGDLLTHLDNFRNYLRSNKKYIGDTTVLFYKNFVKFLQMLAKEGSSMALYNEIKKTDYVASKNWLLTHAKLP